MTLVTSHPFPGELVTLGMREECLPKIAVLDRRAARRLPTLALPGMDPAGHAQRDVLGVGDHVYAGRLGQGFEGADDRDQLHPVVGGSFLGATQLAALSVHVDDGGPTTRSGISRTGAVGEDADVRLAGHAGLPGHHTGPTPCFEGLSG